MTRFQRWTTYDATTVKQRDLRDVVNATGTINAVTTVLAGAQISGRVAKLNADFNSVVRKGYVTAEIDPALFQGALLQAKDDLKSAEANAVAAQANSGKAKDVLNLINRDYFDIAYGEDYQVTPASPLVPSGITVHPREPRQLRLTAKLKF